MTVEQEKLILVQAELEDLKARLDVLESRPGFLRGVWNSALNWTEFGYQWTKRSTGRLCHASGDMIKGALRRTLERGLATLK